MREEFVVHPGETGDVEVLACDADATLRREPRERNVVRSAARPFRFLAHASFSVDYGRFLRAEIELQLKAGVNGLHFLFDALPLHLPVAIPDAAVRCANFCKAGARAAGSFDVIKLVAV